MGFLNDFQFTIERKVNYENSMEPRTGLERHSNSKISRNDVI